MMEDATAFTRMPSPAGISSATYLSRGPPMSGVFKPQGAIVRPASVRNRLSTPQVHRGEGAETRFAGRRARPSIFAAETSNDRFGFLYELPSPSHRAAALVHEDQSPG